MKAVPHPPELSMTVCTSQRIRHCAVSGRFRRGHKPLCPPRALHKPTTTAGGPQPVVQEPWRVNKLLKDCEFVSVLIRAFKVLITYLTTVEASKRSLRALSTSEAVTIGSSSGGVASHSIPTAD